MSWALFLGLAATFVGGFVFLASCIVGQIPRKWPFEPISRHHEPERFAFWQDVSGGTFAFGVLLLIAMKIVR